MFDIPTLLILIPALPLAATLLTAALGPRVLRERSHMPVVTALLLSFAASIMLVFQVQQKIEQTAEQGRAGRVANSENAVTVVSLWRWYAAPQAMSKTKPFQGSWLHEVPPPRFLRSFSNLNIDIALRADPLTAAMLAIVTCISALVAVYSIGYMRGDPGCWRFFAYIGLFVFSMTMLVAASNFVLLFVFWELVGLCSYLLIGFWYEKPAAAAAGMKAFLVNRIGDCGFLLAVFLIWTTYGSLNFHDTVVGGKLVEMGVLGQWRLENASFNHDWPATAICLLLMLGACGKSAQLPLHVWLPDAMEGPTPVSALIHAATMVTAGVYMVARCMPLFVASSDTLQVVAAIGGATALVGAIIAITQNDLKRILAYSTISHLGYMFVALGTGTVLGVTAGMFHLLTHAFFKALLFLGAGSVMHAMGGVIDIRRLGGLRRRMPITHGTFLFGCLAIAGVIPFAGFWSKDAILLALYQRASQGSAENLYSLLFASVMLGIMLIGVYTFRPFFLVFYGPERIPPEAEHHAHESPGVMTVPLMLLAFGSLVVGAYFEWTHGFAAFLQATPSLAYLPAEIAEYPTQTVEHWRIGAMSTGITLVVMIMTATLYLGGQTGTAKLARFLDIFGLYSLSFGKFFFDPIYALFVVRPMLGFARLAALFDHYVIDDLVDLCGKAPRWLGAALRPTQNGMTQFYALAMMLGLLVMLGALLL